MRALAIALLAGVACGGTGSPPIIVDSPDSGTQTDGGTPDAGSDGGDPGGGCAIDSPNRWPNATSELDPPVGYVVPGDGSDPAYDFRFNAGAGAFAGTWVRRLVRTGTGAVSINDVATAAAGHLYFFSAHYKFISDVGPSTIASIRISWFDADRIFLTSQTIILDRAQVTWHATVPVGFIAGAPAGTAYVAADLSLQTVGDGTAEVWFDDLLLVDC